MGRTHLTTPPGQAPDTEGDRQHDGEAYSAGLSLPREPRVPGRHRRTLLTAIGVVVLAVAAVVVFRLVTAGQTFDPALHEQPSPTTDVTG